MNQAENFFRELGRLFGIDDKKFDEIAKSAKEYCDKVKEEVADRLPSVDPGDIPNPMNPGGRSDNQMRKDGWVLTEDKEVDEDGAFVCKRAWKKETPKETPNEYPHCPPRENAPESSPNKHIIDNWMDTMNWALIHNWSSMKKVLYDKFPNNISEIDTILGFIEFIQDKDLIENTDDYGYPFSKLWNSFKTSNAYATAEILDSIIQDIVSSIRDNRDSIVTNMGRLTGQDRKELMFRINKYHGYLEDELDTLIDSMDVIAPEYHHPEIMDKPYVESSAYSMVYLWYSLVSEYLAELITITDEIISAEKVL